MSDATTSPLNESILVVVSDFLQHRRGDVLSDAADLADLMLGDYARFVVPARVHQGDPLLIDGTSALTDEDGREITD